MHSIPPAWGEGAGGGGGGARFTRLLVHELGLEEDFMDIQAVCARGHPFDLCSEALDLQAGPNACPPA